MDSKVKEKYISDADTEATIMVQLSCVNIYFIFRGICRKNIILALLIPFKMPVFCVKGPHIVSS